MSSPETPSDLEASILSLLPQARAIASAPVSGFMVGAVARGSSGRLYLGANLEFTGQGLGTALHAEQSAVAHAWMAGETSITHLAVTAAPCGHCRQFLAELDRVSDLVILGEDGRRDSLAALLPAPFGPAWLGRDAGLMRPQRHDLTFSEGIDDPLVHAALEAARMSYAPYTGGFAGVALELDNRSIVKGAAAENAAFNPSLPAMTVALARLQLDGGAARQILRAVLVERPGPASERPFASAVLESVASCTLEYRPAKLRG
jgi:cytidine deaminase